MNVCIIPAYKPTADMIPLVEQLQNRKITCVVVDDGSGVEYDHLFNSLPTETVFLRHEINRGKGEALKTAMRYILEFIPDAQMIATADADGQHKLEYILESYKHLELNPTSLVLGGRRFDGNVPLRSRFGNAMTRCVFSIAGGVKVYDTQTGLRAFSHDKLAYYIKIPGSRYEYEMNMLLETAQSGIPIAEFTIETVYLDKNESSHFNPIKDSIKIYACIAKYGISSVLSFLIDYVLFLIIASLTQNRLSATISILVAEIGARVISAVFNFVFNKVVVFKGNEHTGVALLKYFVLAVFTLAADYGLVLMAVSWIGLPKSIAKIVVGIVLFIINMIIQGRFVFRKKHSTSIGG